jgi:hypothetical protein
MEQPKQLNIECTLGAVFLPRLGSISSINAKYRTPENNPTSNLSTNYENYVNSAFSKNFKTISRGPGGTIPRLNLTIGAPKATFAEGSIKLNEPHPVYNLLKAAEKSKFDLSKVYRYPSDSKSLPTGQYSGISYGQPYDNKFDYFNMGSAGYIPLSKEISVEQEVRETYNIWKQITSNDLSKKFLIGLGVTNYESIGGVHIETPSGPPIPGIVINAANTACLIERVFPISDDLLYQEPNIYFTKSGGGLIQKKVMAKGGANCGFWLKFQNLSEFSIYRSGNVSKKSSLRFAFGNFNKTYSDKISQFAVIISDNYSILNFLNPRTSKWTTINLSNKANISSGSIDIFVHFAGPNMYIGFDKEITLWNVIDPIALDDTDARFIPYIDHESIIQVYVENFNCIFNYCPICFDAFDQEMIIDSLQDSSYTNKSGNASINISFDASSNDSVALDSCVESEVNERFLKKKYNTSLNYDLTKKDENLPTFYSDWRRINKGERSDQLDEASYLANPELKYFEISKKSNLDKPDDPRTQFRGVVRYETTIEGPVFFYARNFKEDDVLPKEKMVQEIWGNYSDISKYFASAKITEQFIFDNKSYKKTQATIDLINMTNDQIGRQVLNAIQENILTITLKCGFDNDDKKIYFQGFITNVTVNRSSDNFTITLKCLDLGTFLLENIRFNLLNPNPLGFRTLGKLLEDTFELGGLLKFYKPRPKQDTFGFDVLYNEYFNRFLGLQNTQTALLTATLSASMEKSIFNVIEQIIPFWTFGSDSNQTFIDSLPIFRWDPDSETFILALRKDEQPETIWLVGKPGDEQFLANSNKDTVTQKQTMHGVAIGDRAWTEETDVSNLHSEVVMPYRKWDGLLSVERSNPNFISRAVSLNSFNELKNLIKDDPKSQQNLGYVGFNKISYQNLSENSNFSTNKLIKRKLFQEEYSSRYTLQSLTLNVYVTKPLKSHYKFTVDSFEDSGVIDYSGEYIFESVEYDINAESNLIKAKIEGSYLPIPD